MVQAHEHLVPFVRRAAYRVADDNDAIANIHRIEDRRQHTDIGLRSRDNERVRPTVTQVAGQPGFGEGGIARLVDSCRRWAAASGGIDFKSSRGSSSRVAMRQRS